VREALDGLPGAERVVFFDMPRIDVSSSLVRRRAAEGLPVRYLVPDLVAEEIAERGLYSRDAVGASS
jgi:nicotinate-nucleotide adenylyltransferase